MHEFEIGKRHLLTNDAAPFKDRHSRSFQLHELSRPIPSMRSVFGSAFFSEEAPQARHSRSRRGHRHVSGP